MAEQSLAHLPTDINALRRRRGVARASITRLTTRLRELESKTDQPDTVARAQQLFSKLNGLDAEFKVIHLQIVDLVSNDEDLETEQDVLDDHEDKVSSLSFRFQQLCRSSPPPPPVNPMEKNLLSKKLHRLEKSIGTTATSLMGLPDDTDDTALFLQHEAQLADYKSQLSVIREELLVVDHILEDDTLFTLHDDLEKQLFDCSHIIRRRLAQCKTDSPSAPVASSGVKLPKLNVPVFDGNILNWTQFWEQFCISVHDRKNISDAEKLVYLRHALKDGSAKTVIEGLSRSGEQYCEAIDCLKARFNRPRLIHQTHVKCILDSPPLKEGNGKELRKLHDIIQQHIRALKSMGHEPSPSFITSVIELKLDASTMFEWQRHSQSESDVPHYNQLLEFVDQRAQASESVGHSSYKKNDKKFPKPIPSFPTHTTPTCIACKSDKHPLYICQSFKGLTHEHKISLLKSNHICMNCLTSGHHAKSCRSVHRCRRCQGLHHTLLHFENVPKPASTPITSNSAIKINSNCLLMTCRVLLTGPDGSSVEARCLLDNASSASFVTERIAQVLRLPRSYQSVFVSGIEGLSDRITGRFVSQVTASPVSRSDRRFSITAVVVPRVTCDLPTEPIPFALEWDHLSDLTLSDPTFGQPGRIDALLGINTFIDCLLQGRISGPPGSPTAFETEFGWVLGGLIGSHTCNTQVTSHVSCLNDNIRKFWEFEEPPSDKLALSLEESTVMQHFHKSHYRSSEGLFIVPLPRRPNVDPIGESRSQAVRRFLSLERTLSTKGQFSEVDDVMREYLKLGHAEEVPFDDFDKPENTVFYLPMHVVYKSSSTTTKIRAVFDASAKSTSGVSLNDTLLVGPTVHSPLLDVLIRFRMFRIPLITDVSKMYRAIKLDNNDKDFHRFVWRSNCNDNIRDYRMTRLTFGVSASCFAANMSVKQNAVDHCSEFPLAAKMVKESFYVDDGLIGADEVEAAIELRKEMQAMFSRGGFLLRKWNCSNQEVLESIEPEFRDVQEVHSITDSTSNYTKTLGLEWNVKFDCFRITVGKTTCNSDLTKRVLVSNIAKVFDALGWFSPATVKIKILLQRLWESNIDWDELVPPSIMEIWHRWESELSHLSDFHIPRHYFSNVSYSQLESLQLHGFSDASEDAYAAVVYLRSLDRDGNINISLVMAKSRVAPIKRISIPRLELCGALLLSQLLFYLKNIFDLPLTHTFAWTDSTIVLNWLQGSPRRFKTFVGNRVSLIIDRIPAERWRHVMGTENPADTPSRGLFPLELVSHNLWWKGPDWLSKKEIEWPNDSVFEACIPEEEKVSAHPVNIQQLTPIISYDKYSSFYKLIRITSWVHRFINNCRSKNPIKYPYPLITELREAKHYWISRIQYDHFSREIKILKSKSSLPSGSLLLSLNPFLDNKNILRVGGRLSNAKLSFCQRHPIILHQKHILVHRIIHSEHILLLHAGPTLLVASLSRDYHIFGLRKAARSITRQCVICRRQAAKPECQLMGQLPMERVSPGIVFENVGVDYAGPILIKYGHVRRPTVVKAYISVFVSLSVRAVHLELVSDLTSEAFIACLRRFVARRGCPNQIWSDHGTNFVGANREIREFYDFLSNQILQCNVSQFCSSKGIEWKFIPERSPNFGGLWESTVKSMKIHFRKVTANIKLTYEEASTTLVQIEACLNSRPLTSILTDNEGIEVLTPGHFLIGQPLTAVPDPPSSYNISITLLRRWQLCQSIVRQFWSRWSSEYLINLNRFHKWKCPNRNIEVGDVVILREDNMSPMKWPLARVINVHKGKDGYVRVVDLKTSRGEYRRPISKVVMLLQGSHAD